MTAKRRRRTAWMFALVLAMELALLCCAYGHVSHHLCDEAESCVLCACLRLAARRHSVLPAVAAILTALCGIAFLPLARACFLQLNTPVSRRTRLND